MQKKRVRMLSAVCHGEAREVEAGGKPWLHDAWTVTLGCDDRTLVTPWKAGTGHRHQQTGKPMTPKAHEVLEALLSDASLGTESFAEFCSSLGYSEDSRKALASYLECQGMRAKLRELLGMDPMSLLGERGTDEVAADLCPVRRGGDS